MTIESLCWIGWTLAAIGWAAFSVVILAVVEATEEGRAGPGEIVDYRKDHVDRSAHYKPR